MTSFDQLDLAPSILKSVKEMGFEKPTPIQRDAIPLVLQGHDVMGLAQTGTGKTAAFGLPLVHHLLARHDRPAAKTARALIMAPTRELVNQIADHLRAYVRHTRLRVNVVMGGVSIHGQRQKLARGTDILVATPGRLLDLAERRSVFLDTVDFLVLDEADQMLDMGFIHTLRKLEKMIGKERQTMLFSATMPRQIETLAAEYLFEPKRIQAATPGKAADKVRQTVHFVAPGEKIALLKKCLHNNDDDVSIVFARTKHGAEKLMKNLRAAGFPADSIHGNKSQGQRDRTLKGFRNGQVRILVATDVAARGIDIPGVSHVYNYDLPEVAENYVHRIGRTARAGADGEAVAFCTTETYGLLRAVERLMDITIETESGERPERALPATRRPQRRTPRRGGNHQARSGKSENGKRSYGKSNDGKPGRDAYKKRRKPAGDRARAETGEQGGHGGSFAKGSQADAGKPRTQKASGKPRARRNDGGGKPGGGSGRPSLGKNAPRRRPRRKAAAA